MPRQNAQERTPHQRTPLSVRRMRLTLVLVLALLVAVGGRLVWVQGIDPQDAAAKALASRTSPDVTVPAVRGQIVDSDGSVLATSVIRYNLVVDQRQVKDTFRRKNARTGTLEVVNTKEAVSDLAKVLGLDDAAVQTAVFGTEGKAKKGYSVITKNITPEADAKAEKIGIPWLTPEQTSRRSYPNGKLAGSVLGFLNDQEEGAEGLELSQDSHLQGTDGSKTYERGADGVRIPTAPVQETEPKDGQSVKLTLDSDIQWVAQEAVMAKQKEYGAEWVNAVVMDVKTGKILALGDSDSMDPNDPGASDADSRTSSTVTQAYEPGSTGKGPTFALALEKGLITPTTAFTVPNAYTINGQTINDSLKHATYKMTAAGIFARSYNTGTVQIGDKVSDQDRYDFMTKLGIGQQTDIGLPGVNKGILASPADWGTRQRLTIMFGQGYTTTTLQTASVYQALVNDGVQISPRLIDAYVDADGTEHPVQAAKKQRVISSKTSKEMRRMMETVVDVGTGTLSQIDGYRVGGKSGTAQAVGSTGKLDQHTSSFVGVAPIENPRYLVAVTMQHPTGNWRSWHVNDAFTKIMSAVLNKYSVAPDTSKSEAYDAFVGKNQKYAW